MTTWNPDIWTGEVRRVLFQLLVKKFEYGLSGARPR
jgi:hypothetical protein